MCVYRGQEIAGRCQEIARLQHEVEELLAQQDCRSWAIAAREAREALLRRRDARAVEVLDRIAGEEPGQPWRVSAEEGREIARLAGIPDLCDEEKARIMLEKAREGVEG